MPKQAPIEISPRRPNPNVLFTDRERERELLQRIMSPTVTPEETPELFLTVLYGVGGSGKSALATKARQAAGEYATVRVVSVDFDSDVWKADSSYLAVAGALAKAFARDGVQVPLLEFLLALHNVQGAISAKADVRGWALFKSVVAKAASPIPAAGPIADLLVKLGEWVFDHARTTQLVSEIIDFGLWPVERSGCIDLQDLESRLAQALFVDLRNLLDREREMHVRVLFDGFDRIQGNQLRPDAQHHIQRLLGYCAVSLDRDVFDRLRVVIFSRESLKWDTLYGDSEWSRHWSQHLVSGFAEADAREYIGRWRTWFDDTGKEEVAVALRREEGRILDVSLESAIGHRAYSPFSLTLAVTEIDTACASGRSDFELHSASGDIRMSLLRHLDWAERRALMTLAIVGTFDSNLFDWLAENQLISFPVGSFASSVHQERCYFEATAPDSWRFNRLFSEALLAEWTTSEADAVMERLLGYWVAKLETPERDWTEPDIATWCTGFEILLSRGLERKLLSHERFQELAAQSPWNSWNFRLLSARLGFLQRIVAFEEANLGADHLDTLASIQNLAVLLGKRGSYADAEALLRRALCLIVYS